MVSTNNANAQQAPTAFDVFVTEPGPKVLKVARLASQLGGIDIEKLMESLEEPPALVKEGASSEEAEEVKRQLEELGAAIELKTSTSVPTFSMPKAAFMEIVLKKSGTKSMAVAKKLSQLTGGDLDTLLEAVEELPYVIDKKRPTAEAMEIKKQLEALGAVVELTPVKPTHVDVILTNTGRKTMGIAKIIAQSTGKDMDAILEALEDLPFTVVKGMPTDEAETFQKQLEAAGAKIELKEAAAPAKGRATKKQDSYEVILLKAGSEYMRVIEILKALANIETDQGLKLITHLPATVASGLSKSDAQTLQDALQGVGAEVKINPPLTMEKQPPLENKQKPSNAQNKTTAPQAKPTPQKTTNSEAERESILRQIDEILRGINDDKVFTCFKQNRTKLNNAVAKYAGDYLKYKERFLLQVDETLFGSADEGCVITDKAIYGRETFENGKRIPLNKRIKTINAYDGSKGIIIDGNRLCTLIMPNKTTVPQILKLLKEVSKLNE